MRRFKTYVTQHRRRREGRTDYKQRLALLKSGKPRLVIRKTLNNTVCQIVKHGTEGDKTIVNVTGKDVRKIGWKGHLGNIPSSYLIGMICGLEAKKKKITEVVLDMGLHTSTNGSRIYAALKGAIDAGLKIPHSEEILPDEKRISGKHVEEYAKLLRSGKPQDYKRQFSKYIKNKILPEEMSKHFEEVKKKILGKK